MTNFLLFTIIAILLFGASAVRESVSGVIWTVTVIAVIIGIFWFVFSFGNKYKKDNDTRKGTQFFAWLGIVYFLFKWQLDLVAYTFLIGAPLYYFFNMINKRVEKEGKHKVFSGYKLTFMKFLNSGMGIFITISIFLSLIMTVISIIRR